MEMWRGSGSILHRLASLTLPLAYVHVGDGPLVWSTSLGHCDPLFLLGYTEDNTIELNQIQVYVLMEFLIGTD